MQAVYCDVRGKALVSHTGVGGFDSRGGDCLLLFAGYNLRSIYKSRKMRISNRKPIHSIDMENILVLTYKMKLIGNVLYEVYGKTESRWDDNIQVEGFNPSPRRPTKAATSMCKPVLI